MSEVSRHPLYRQAVEDFLGQFEYGDIVSHAWLESRFGIPSLDSAERLTAEQFRDRQFDWLANLEAFKTILLREHQVCLQSVRGKGYRWVPPHEQTEVVVGEFHRGAKKLFSRVGGGLRNLRISELTDEQRRANMDAAAKISALAGMASKRLLP